MTRATKRKSDNPAAAPVKIGRADSVSSASSRAATKLVERIDEFYGKYSNKSSGVIDPEGIELLCSDLKVDHTDVRILMLAWKMNSQRQGYFTRVLEKKLYLRVKGVLKELRNKKEEWQRGLKALRADTINKLKKSLPGLEKETLNSENFEDFYKFAFRYCLTEEKQKCLDLESTCLLLKLVLGHKYQPQVDSFTEFLNIQTEYKVMNVDQWTNFLRFCQEISFPSLENYDTGEAWPLLLDNFVDWIKQK